MRGARTANMPRSTASRARRRLSLSAVTVVSARMDFRVSGSSVTGSSVFSTASFSKARTAFSNAFQDTC